MIIENVNNVSIVNVTVTNFFIGIYFNNSSHNKILECSIINNARGIEFDSYSMFNMVHKSVVRGNSQYGIIVGEDGSNNNVISENFIEDNFQGVWLDTSNNSILKNTIANNYFEGIRLNGDNNNVFENTILYHYYPGILVMGSRARVRLSFQEFERIRKETMV
jgi:parallel beta-helix repeat protein